MALTRGTPVTDRRAARGIALELRRALVRHGQHGQHGRPNEDDP
ncbi:hypothetical protein [Streptomyces coerulescens]|uniref:Uncharacterized protein n=1 Tax=Streptomyces coerulescens TaxID=29304 RepID=A0ABW0CHV5_STRCD